MEKRKYALLVQKREEIFNEFITTMHYTDRLLTLSLSEQYENFFTKFILSINAKRL